MIQYAPWGFETPTWLQTRFISNDDVARGSRSKTNQEAPQEGAQADGSRHAKSGAPAAKTLLTDGGVAVGDTDTSTDTDTQTIHVADCKHCDWHVESPDPVDVGEAIGRHEDTRQIDGPTPWHTVTEWTEEQGR